MAELTINLTSLKSFYRSLKQWAKDDFEEDVDKASLKLVDKYKQQIKAGKTGAEGIMRAVKPVTLDMPIRIDSDSAIRREVNPSVKPLVARGRAVNSIKRRRAGDKFLIEPSTLHGKRVFVDNAFPSVRGIQRTQKVVRDPLIVSDIQVDIIEKEILKGIDKAIRR